MIPSNDGSVFGPFHFVGYTWYVWPPAAGIGSGRVRTVTIFVAFAAGPLTPSGSVMTKRASYAVPGSRSRMLPANMFGVTALNTFR